MNRTKVFVIASTLLSLCQISAARNLFEGLYTGALVLYSNSDLETNYSKQVGNLTTSEKRHYSMSGFSGGASVGYRYAIDEGISIGAGITGFMSNAEQIEKYSGNSNREFTAALNYAIYPMAEFGYSPMEETIFLAKIGYGLENINSKMVDTPTITKPDYNTSGIVGSAEIAGFVTNKVILGLSVFYSNLEKHTVQDDGTTPTCELCTLPKTLSAGINVQYMPEGIVF